MRTYSLDSWIDPRVELQVSKIQGVGLVAQAPIRQGEIVVIWGGTVLTEADVKAGRARKHSTAAIDEGLYLAALADEPASPDDFMNHSCDPTVWMIDEVTLAARRDIAAGEELTADYAMWGADEDWVVGWTCRCGAAHCRGTVTGRDWRLPEVQARYRDHFSPFINARIRRGGS